MPAVAPDDPPMILLTGATGYVGGRLLAALVGRGRAVRCLVRRPEALAAPGGAQVVRGDVADPAALGAAMRGVGVAVYLVHSMSDAGGFAARDREAARRFGAAARAAGVRRIVYLGGLGRGRALSEHLASRHETGEILRASGVPVVELRASIVIGAGSTSFELARALVEKLPVMVTPRWVRTLAQPIAIDDVVAYLVEAIEADLPHGGLFEIGGADAVSYGDIMAEIARARGLRRLMIPVPALSPRLSGLWLRLVAPRHAAVGRALIEGVRNETTVADGAARRAFGVRPVGIAEAVRRALAGSPLPRPALAGARSAGALLLCLAASAAAAAAGAWFTREAVGSWYPSLARPPWTPPPWLFGPVWAVLYAAMAVAAWRVWRRDGLREARLPLGLFAVHLLLNAAWPAIFFGLRAPWLALAEILALWATIAATTVLFAARDGPAAGLMLPYLGWVAFAAALNGAIAWMNA